MRVYYERTECTRCGGSILVPLKELYLPHQHADWAHCDAEKRRRDPIFYIREVARREKARAQFHLARLVADARAELGLDARPEADQPPARRRGAGWPKVRS